MPLHSLHGLIKGDYTAIANLGQCLPREVVENQVVHVADESFPGAAVRLLRVRAVMFRVRAERQGSGGWFHCIRVSVSFRAPNSNLERQLSQFSDEHCSEGGAVRGPTFQRENISVGILCSLFLFFPPRNLNIHEEFFFYKGSIHFIIVCITIILKDANGTFKIKSFRNTWVRYSATKLKDQKDKDAGSQLSRAKKH